MRVFQKWLLLAMSLTMFSCGEPSFLGTAGQPDLEYALFKMSVGDPLSSPPEVVSGNTTAVFIADGATFSPKWDISYIGAVTVKVSVVAPPVGDPAVELFTVNCSSTGGSCAMKDGINCVYDLAGLTATCTVNLADQVKDLSPLATQIGTGQTLYLKFTACVTSDSTNCAPAGQIQIMFEG